jgi:SAM-dependent methyltransferase
MNTPRVVWRQEHVVDVRDAAFAVRTYVEHQDVRTFLTRAVAGRRFAAACEVGAGYGRMTVVLTEFFDAVVGFEREPHFVEEAARLLPAIRFEQVDSLARLPASNESFDGVLTFTVLQHLTDRVALDVAGEIARILRPGGFLVICEETDPAHRAGAVDDPGGMCTIGRSVAGYQALFSGFTLLDTAPRRIEPTYERPDVGAYMLFLKPAPVCF